MYKATIVLFMTVLLFFSCDQNKTSKKTESVLKQKDVNQNESQDTVLLTVAANIFKMSFIPDTLNVKMTNHTRDTLTTGLHYDIQKFENNEWIQVLPDQVVQDLGFRLLPFESKYFTIRMRKNEVAYKSGNYRIVKYYLNHDYKKTRKQFSVSAEFRIK